MEYDIRKLEEKIRKLENECIEIQTKIDYSIKKKVSI